jgi:hypothetical protein
MDEEAPRCEMPELIQRLREVEAQLARLRAIILHQPMPVSDPFENRTDQEEYRSS